MSVTSVINGQAAVTWSRISNILMPILFVALTTVAGFALHQYMDNQQRVDDHLDSRLSTVEAWVPLASARLGTLETSTNLGRQDRLAFQSSITSSVSDIDAKLDSHSNTLSQMNASLAGISATLDILKQKVLAEGPTTTMDRSVEPAALASSTR